MKTSELIGALASAGGEPSPPRRPLARITPAAIAGVVLALAALSLWLGMQPLAAAIRADWFWMKAAYCLALAVSGLLILLPSLRPGGRISAVGLAALAMALAGIAVMAGQELVSAPAMLWPKLWLGDSWDLCPWRILLLAAPIYALLIVGARPLAPTRLGLAGAAAGLMAGGLAGAVYGFYCQEHTAPFVALWYSLGIGLSAALGALVGARLLRW
jgi:hypothetical protein